MKRPTKLGALLVLLAPLAGCSKSIVAIANCNVGNIVTVSRQDVLTERTASDIEANNKSRRAAGCEDAKGNG